MWTIVLPRFEKSQNPINSLVMSPIRRFSRKYCNVSIHCEFLVDGILGHELAQEHSQ